ncbi:MAG: T9SS type A sorting domain-containing protein [Ignavibacteria bacterium]|nr:T9SS type A sorting domain-containing protein [Ignavibacteria bacterium]
MTLRNIILFFVLSPICANSQWFTQTSGTSRHLYGMDVVDPNVVYCAAELGTNVKTTNGGTNWFNIPPPTTGDDYGDCSFININTGVFVGPGGILIRTTDGGNSWAIIFHQLSGLIDVQFVNSNWVYACGTSGVIRSTNGGLNWILLTNFSQLVGRKLFFTDSLTGTLVGLNGFIITTTNGGINWTQRYMMLPVQFGDSSLYDIQYINSSTGFIGGNNGIFIKTTNGGINWSYLPTGTITQLIAIYFLNENTGYIAGTAGNMFRTTNGGINWVQQTTGVSDYFFDIEFININTGWACGLNGLILKTTNGGSTWIKPINTEVPGSYKLYQNYPNPFNSMTNVKFQMSNAGNVSLKIYDVLGKEVTTLVNERFQPGTYQVSFDGSGLPSGVYFCKFESGDFSAVTKMILLK